MLKATPLIFFFFHCGHDVIVFVLCTSEESPQLFNVLFCVFFFLIDVPLCFDKCLECQQVCFVIFSGFIVIVVVFVRSAKCILYIEMLVILSFCEKKRGAMGYKFFTKILVIISL